jgi:hypothetical protein
MFYNVLKEYVVSIFGTNTRGKIPAWKQAEKYFFFAYLIIDFKLQVYESKVVGQIFCLKKDVKLVASFNITQQGMA